MATNFLQTATSASNGEYAWSNISNWSNGLPTTGGIVNFNTTGGGNPSGYDDIASLTLATLNLTSGFIGVAGTLTVNSLALGPTSTTRAIYSYTLLSGGTASLTIASISGTGAEIEAEGPGAATYVTAATDPGEDYQVDEGGLLVLSATPNSTSTFDLGTYGTADLGTIAFKNPGSTVSSYLATIGNGEAIELPGTSVSSVTFTSTSVKVVTNIGTTTFSNAHFAANQLLHGFVAAADPSTGLEKITIQGSAISTFKQGVTSLVNGGHEYAWSTAANWTGGVPVNGGVATVDISAATNPGGYDDIANLELYQLSLSQGAIAVAGTLTVDDLILPSNSSSYALEADTLLGGASAKLTIDAITGNGAFIEADGATAKTFVNAASDTGNEYDAAGGGFLELSANPAATSTLDFPSYSGDFGTIALANPSASIAARLGGVAIGDVLELPGSSVSSVVFGTSSLAIKTNLGTTNFTNVRYDAGEVMHGFVATADAATGLEQITLQGSTISAFQQTSTSLVNGAQEYAWSTAANWTAGVPANGGVATVDISAATNPGGYDDIANLELYQLSLTQGAIAVAGTLTVDDLILPSSSNSYALEADTLLGGASAKLTIDAITGNGAFIEADGATAKTFVNAASDTGNEYDAAGGGFLELSANPAATSTLDFPSYSGDFGTIALANPSASIAARLGGVAIGDVLELPGSSVTSVSYGANTLSVTTNLGTTNFTNVRYDAGEVMHGFAATADAATGLEKITLQGSTISAFQQTSTSLVNGAQEYAWSTAANWTAGVPANGGIATVNISAATNPGGYDDIANLELYQLSLTQGAIAVAGTLTVDDLILPSNSSSYALEADTLLGGASAKLTIDAITGNGAFIEADGATAKTFVNAASDTGNEYDAAGGGFLELSANPAATSTLDFPSYSGDFGTIALANPSASIAARLGGVAIGDVLELPGSSVSSVVFGTSSLAIKTNLGTTNFTNVRYDAGEPLKSYVASHDAATGLEKITIIACYLRGTRIGTPTGDVAIEALAIGDLVRTASGEDMPIRWIGKRAYGGRFLARNRGMQPVRICAGALGEGAPRRDLFVSPLHAMLLDGVLVPATNLVNGVTIFQETTLDSVEYFHVELSRHDIVLAEGAESESFVDDDSRAMFHNAHEFYELHPRAERVPAAYCAPRVTGGYELEAIRRRLGARAGPRPEEKRPEKPNAAGCRDHVRRSSDGDAPPGRNGAGATAA